MKHILSAKRPDSFYFGLNNIPFGVVYNSALGRAQCCTRIGDYLVNLAALHHLHPLRSFSQNVFDRDSLNLFIKQGKQAWSETRAWIQSSFAENSNLSSETIQGCVLSVEEAKMQLPVYVRSFTDFSASINHARNMALFKQKNKELYPNYTHLPIAYASRSSTLLPSGTHIRRPLAHVFRNNQPSEQLSSEVDFQLEMAMVVGKENSQFERIQMQNALDHIFGMVLLNDWSARDILSWEAAPLGPFNSKNFATGVGEWIVPLEALLPYQIQMQEQQPSPLPYLQGN